MSSSLHVWRVDLRQRASRIFLWLIPLLHLLAIIAVMQAGLALPLRLALVIVLLAVCAFSLRQEMQTTGTIVREQTTAWWLETAERSGVAELRHCRVWRYLVVMDFLCRNEDKTWYQHVVIFPDSVAPDSFRRLRVRLRYGPRVQGAMPS